MLGMGRAVDACFVENVIQTFQTGVKIFVTDETFDCRRQSARDRPAELQDWAIPATLVPQRHRDKGHRGYACGRFRFRSLAGSPPCKPRPDLMTTLIPRSQAKGSISSADLSHAL